MLFQQYDRVVRSQFEEDGYMTPEVNENTPNSPERLSDKQPWSAPVLQIASIAGDTDNGSNLGSDGATPSVSGS